MLRVTESQDKSIEQQIRELKAQGFGRRRISNQLGVSERTVQKTLSLISERTEEVKPKSPSQSSANALYKLATRPEGVKPSEEYKVWDNFFLMSGSHPTYEQKKYVKRLVRERSNDEGTETLYVPEWMDREASKECNQYKNELAQSIHVHISELCNEFASFYPSDNPYADVEKSIRKELLAILFTEINKSEPLEHKLNRTQNVANKLRGCKSKLKIGIKYDKELDSICM